jgi:pyruvate/2-oxoglutarate dehydrogenase complex dihydrolipoamide dehydrogenase (E3) component
MYQHDPSCRLTPFKTRTPVIPACRWALLLWPSPFGRSFSKVNASFQTMVPHIYAAGDVIAATSMEQGRLAAAHMFGAPSSAEASVLAYGIYTIPEIAMVGRTETVNNRRHSL